MVYIFIYIDMHAYKLFINTKLINNYMNIADNTIPALWVVSFCGTNASTGSPGYINSIVSSC